MILGVVTGCVGGILRDVVAGVPSIMMRPDLYVTAAAFAAATTTGAMLLGLPDTPALLLGAVCGFALRGAAIVWNLKLPAHRLTAAKAEPEGRCAKARLVSEVMAALTLRAGQAQVGLRTRP